MAGARGAMRGLLAQEIHHRVKNNLQTVASLLRLAASGDADPHRALRDSVSRVLSIAEVHDLLTSTREDDVDGADLVQRLADMLRQTLGARGVHSELMPVVLPAGPGHRAGAGLLRALLERARARRAATSRSPCERSNGYAELERPRPRLRPVHRAGRRAAARACRSPAPWPSPTWPARLDFGDATPGVRGVVRFPLSWEGA